MIEHYMHRLTKSTISYILYMIVKYGWGFNTSLIATAAVHHYNVIHAQHLVLVLYLKQLL